MRVPDRNRVLQDLRVAGVEAGIHFPVPIHLQKSFDWLDLGPGSFPETERAAREILSLPEFPEITVAQQERVVEVLRRSVSQVS